MTAITVQQVVHDQLVLIEVDAGTMRVKLMNYGASILAIEVPDKAGTMANVVLGLQQPEDYLQQRSFLGAAIGRNAGRIPEAKLKIAGKEARFTQNEGHHHLHGGETGFDNVYWQVAVVETAALATIIFSRTFSDGQEGYPGNLIMEIHYTINLQQQITLTYLGYVDQPSLLNPTNHTYFNLSGSDQEIGASHYLQLASETVVLLDQDHLLTKAAALTSDSPFDFRRPKQLSVCLEAADKQIQQEDGLNHPFLFTGESYQKVHLSCPESGRLLEIATGASGIVCYTGNHFSGRDCLMKHAGIALETQELVGFSPSKNYLAAQQQPFYTWTCWRFSVSDTI